MKENISRLPLLALIVLLFLSFSSGVVHSEDLKIGYVNAQKVLDESLPGQKIKESLNAYVQTRQKIVDLEEEELRKLQEEITKQQDILTPEAKKDKEELFQRRFMEYQQKVGELQREIQQRRTEKLEEFNNKLAKVTGKIGKEEGYLLILNNLDVNIILYAKPSIDLTDRVIAEMNKDFLKKGKEKK